MTPRYLGVLNAGSSSVKFALRRTGPELPLTLSGQVEAIGVAPRLELKDSDGTQVREQNWPAAGFDHSAATQAIITVMQTQLGSGAIAAVGHRVVHGGPNLRRHCLIDDAVLGQLEAATAFAPLHNPPALSVIRFAQEHFPQLPQVACFDTAFHAGMPDVARILPLPLQLRSDGIHRYGFHGLSCESVVRQLGDDLPDRLIIAHLGNGVSVTAVKGGHSDGERIAAQRHQRDEPPDRPPGGEAR